MKQLYDVILAGLHTPVSVIATDPEDAAWQGLQLADDFKTSFTTSFLALEIFSILRIRMSDARRRRLGFFRVPMRNKPLGPRCTDFGWLLPSFGPIDSRI